MPTNENIELRSEEVQDIIARVPPWMTRWGSTLIFIFVILLVGLSFLIRYPDTIEGEVIVSTAEPPIRLLTVQGGQLTRLSVTDGQSIKRGAVIAELKQPFSVSDLHKVGKFVEAAEITIRENKTTFPVAPERIVLGSLQPEWNELLSNVRELENLLQTNVPEQREALIRNEIRLRKEALKVEQAKLDLLNRDQKRLTDRYESSKRLFEGKAISKTELTTDEQKAEGAQLAVEDARERIVQNEIQVNDLQSELFELEYNSTDEIRILKNSILGTIRKFRALAQTWEQENVIKSPINGVLSIPNRLIVNQYYEPGKELFAVLPESKTFTAVIQIGMQGAGKVRKGQKVRISLVDYPENEFGTIEGTVQKIAAIPSEQKYKVLVRLPHGLHTSYGKDIPAKAELQGTAVIITEKRRLIERFFGNLRKLVGSK